MYEAGRSMNNSSDDQSIEQLLQGVGKRDLPSAAVTEQVRQAVQGEWRELVEQRQRRSRLVAYAVAASVVGVILAVMVSLQFHSASAVPVASVARVEGLLQVDPAGSGDWRTLVSGEQISTGDTLRTEEGT